jgi:hypothetical protein
MPLGKQAGLRPANGHRLAKEENWQPVLKSIDESKGYS